MRAKYLIFSFFSLFLGFGAEWAPTYLSIFASTDYRVLGELKNYQSICDLPGTDNAVCTHEYRIPTADFVSGSAENLSLGIGIVLNASRVWCVGSSGKVLAEFGDIRRPGAIYDLMNLYQSVRIPSEGCSEVRIEAWSARGARRTGYVGGKLAVGRTYEIERLSRLISFLNSDLRLFVALIFIAFFFLSRSVSSIGAQEVESDPFERYIASWVMFLVLSSGFVQAIFPLTSHQSLFSRVSAFFSLVAHFLPVFSFINSAGFLPAFSSFMLRPLLRRKFLGVFEISPGFLFFFAISISPWYISLFAYSGIILSLLAVFSGAFRSSVILLSYGSLLLVNWLKIFGFTGLPHSHVASLFVAAYFAQRFHDKYRAGRKLNATIDWARRIGHSPTESDSLLGVLADFKERFSLGQVSLLRVLDGGRCRVDVLKGSCFEVVQLESPPPVFAHVLSTREMLWNIHEDSILALNLKTKENKEFNYSGKLFTVVPLTSHDQVVGAFSFTGYDLVHLTDVDRLNEIRAAIELIRPVISREIEKSGLQQESDWTRVQIEISDQITAMASAPLREGTEYWAKLSDILFEGLAASGFVARLDYSTRRYQILGISGYSMELKEEYLKRNLYAFSHNEQGPLALVVSKEKPIVISDLRWIKGLLYPGSRELLERNGTGSCAAVPIFDDQRSGRSVWGVIWIERSKGAEVLTPWFEQGLTKLANAVEVFLKAERVARVNTEIELVLAPFVPSRVREKLIAGKSVREDDNGLLMMVDIRGSTRLSQKIGGKEWEAFAGILSERVSEICKSAGYVLQATVWDAFFITKSTAQIGISDDDVALMNKIEELVRVELLSRYDADVVDLNHEGRAVRVCAVYGDISRDLVSGVTKSWTIVGTAMASVHKLEQACKGQSGWVFSDKSCLSLSDTDSWKPINVEISGKDTVVYRLREANNFQVVLNDDDKKAA
ncbi:MAG: GAF domain-containing protein [Bdellovibrionales bacterium]|nr:GAF domain-containing protein [Bdellovibrionales bacterium]